MVLHLRDQSENEEEHKKIKKILGENRSEDLEYVLTKGENIGFGRGHNTLFNDLTKVTHSDFFILNPDGLIFDDFFIEFQKHLDYFERSAENGFKWGMLEIHQFPAEHPKEYDPANLRTNWVSCAAVFIDRDMFVATNGFDDNIFMYGEDVDLSMRSKILGYELYHLPTVRFVHISYGLDLDKDTSFINKYIPASELYLRHKYMGEDNVMEFETKLLNHPFRNEIIAIYNKLSKNLTDEYLGKIDLLPYKGTYARHRW